MTETKIKPFHERLLAARKQVGPLLRKDDQAPREAGGYAYHSVAKTLDVVRSALDEHGILMFPRIRDVVIESARDVNKRGAVERSYLLLVAEVELRCAHEPELFEMISAAGMETTDREVGGGIAWAYAVKQALLKHFVIGEGGDDPEALGAKEGPPQGGQDHPPPPTQAEQKPGPDDPLDKEGREWITGYANHYQVSLVDEMKKHNIESLEKMTRGQARALMQNWKMAAEGP